MGGKLGLQEFVGYSPQRFRTGKAVELCRSLVPIGNVVAGVAIFRGLIDVLAHRFIPAPTLYGAEDELREEDIVSRRRVYYWRRKFRFVWRLFIFGALCVGIAMIYNAITGGDSTAAST